MYIITFQESTPFEKSIQRDLARTFPEHPLFKEKDGIGQESLLNLTKVRKRREGRGDKSQLVNNVHRHYSTTFIPLYLVYGTR